MTQFVVVSPGVGTVLPSGPQYGVPYTLVNSDGARCVFNDPEDADYVGWLTDITGLDSPELREAADDLVGDDGGVHGRFFYGRRPITLEGMIDPRPDPTERNVRMTRLQHASNATRGDASLRWMPEGGVEQTVSVRRQQPLRITGSYMKAFQLAVVSSDPRIYGAQMREQVFLPNVAGGTVTNYGTMRTPPTITLTGPGSILEVHNHTTGEEMVFVAGYSLSGGQSVTLNFTSRTVIRENGTNVFQFLDLPNTTWFELAPGENVLEFHAPVGSTGATKMTVNWRDAWV